MGAPCHRVTPPDGLRSWRPVGAGLTDVVENWSNPVPHTNCETAA
jgi:hypothetical protein